MSIAEEIIIVLERAKTKKGLFTPLWSYEEYNELINSDSFKDNVPESFLNTVFRELLQPLNFAYEEGSRIGIKTVYGRLNDNADAEYNPGNSEGRWYSFSVLTKQMVSVEEEYLNLCEQQERRYSALDILYKPYWYELSAWVDNDSLEYEKVQRLEPGKWYELEILKDKDRNKKEDAKEAESPWILSYAASPFEIQEVSLKWIKDLNAEKIPKNYKIQNLASDPKEITNELTNLFSNVTQCSLRVYKAEQANSICGHIVSNGSAKRFAFDLGFPAPKNLNESSGNRIETAVSRFEPDLVLISHWHQDHYTATFTLSRRVYMNKKMKWIVPPYPDKYYHDYNTERLLYYLQKRGMILFVPDGYYFRNGTYALFRTSDPMDENTNGLLLELNTTLLPGDNGNYINWPSGYGDRTNNSVKIENIVIPHHGSGRYFNIANQKRITSLLSAVSNKKAIVCVGLSKDDLPKDNVLDFYKNDLQFNEVIKTNEVKAPCIELIIQDM